MAIIRNVSVAFGANTAGFTSGIYKATGALNMMSRASNIAKGAALGVIGGFGVVAGAMAIKDFFVGGIKGASDLAETMSKTTQVFGSSTDAVVANADRMAQAFGLPKQEMLDAAASFGLIAQGAGLGQAQAAEMSVSLANLAADASSFYNVPIDQALEKIRSGLVGESEPLRAFGVLLSEGAVQAEALRMGLGGSGGKLDEQAKVMARTSLITKGLATASGDLARTQDSASNQFRKTGGILQNFSTSMGQTLLPAVGAVTLVFNDMLSSVAGVFESNKAMFTGWAESFAASIEFIKKVFRNLPLYAEIAWHKMWESLLNLINIIEVLPQNLGIVAAYLAGNWVNMIRDAVMAVWTAFLNMSNNIGELWHAIQNVFATGEWDPHFKDILEDFEATTAALPEMIKPEVASRATEIADLMERIEADEAALKGPAAPTAAAKAIEDAAGTVATGRQEYKGVAAVMAGSTEASSALSRFFNRTTGDTAAKKTADNTGTLVEIETRNGEKLDDIASSMNLGEEGGLAVASL